MPTALRLGPYRFFFYSLENREPPHIHVEEGENVANVLDFDSGVSIKPRDFGRMN
jgi:hypothetical protein